MLHTPVTPCPTADLAPHLPANAALTEHVAAIRALRSRIVSDVAEIGRRLSEAKSIVGHGNWLPWLDQEFGWTERTALNFIRVYKFTERVSNSKSVSNLILSFPVSSVYLLAAPSTPEPAKTEILGRIVAGEVLKAPEIKRTIEAAKAAKPNKAAKRTTAVAPKPTAPVARDPIAADQELVLLREFARFVITRARSVSTDPEDHAEWKALRGRVQATLGITP